MSTQNRLSPLQRIAGFLGVAGSIALINFPVWAQLNLGNFSIQSNPSQIIWSKAAPSPIGRSEAQGAFVDGKIYVFGGYTDTTFIPKSKRVDVYDPGNNTWTRIKNMPVATTHAGTAVDGKDIYFAGGVVGTATGERLNASKDVWKYNVDTQTWTAMPSLPDARGAGELAVLDRRLHFFGGTGFDREEAKSDHWVLSLDGGTSWETAVELPDPRNHLADAVINGKIYAIGGQHGHNQNLVAQNSVYVWDPANPTIWTPVANMPKALSHIAGGTFVMDNQIIVAGGEISHGKSISDVIAYDPVSNSWTALTPLPAVRHSGIAGSIGNQIFYTGGSFNGFQRTTYKGVPVLISQRVFSKPDVTFARTTSKHGN